MLLTAHSKAQSAANQAQQILQTEANYVPALMISAATDEHAGNFKAALDTCEKVLKIFPLFAPGGKATGHPGRKALPDDASGYAFAEKARAAYPDDPEVAKSLGILSFSQAKYARSVELLQESIARNSDDGELYYYLGMDDYQLKRNKESKQALGQSLALNIPDKLAAEAKRVLAELK